MLYRIILAYMKMSAVYSIIYVRMRNVMGTSESVRNVQVRNYKLKIFAIIQLVHICQKAKIAPKVDGFHQVDRFNSQLRMLFSWARLAPACHHL